MILLTEIYCEQNLAQSMGVFELKDIGRVLPIISVGQFVKSNNFVLHFPNSIGLSHWELLLFPNGQYDSEGTVDERVHLYLKMVKCTKMSEEIKLDVKFQLGNCVGWKSHQSFCFNKRTRWIGTHLIGAKQLLSNNDAVLISVQLTEHLKRSVSCINIEHQSILGDLSCRVYSN